MNFCRDGNLLSIIKDVSKVNLPSCSQTKLNVIARAFGKRMATISLRARGNPAGQSFGAKTSSNTPNGLPRRREARSNKKIALSFSPTGLRPPRNDGTFSLG